MTDLINHSLDSQHKKDSKTAMQVMQCHTMQDPACCMQHDAKVKLTDRNNYYDVITLENRIPVHECTGIYLIRNSYDRTYKVYTNRIYEHAKGV